MTSQKMKIATILFAVALTCTPMEGKVLRYRRGANDLKESYIVHYNNKGEPLTVAGFDEFVRVLNRQQPKSGSKLTSYAESPIFSPLQVSSTTASESVTTTEPTTSHQPRPLATGTSRTPSSIVTETTSPEPLTYVTIGSTSVPLKLPHEISGTSPMAEASVSTDKPTLTLALGHEAATTSVHPGGPTLPDVSNLVTPDENSPSKMTVSGLGLTQGIGLTSKVISLQPGVQTVLNYAPPPVAIHGYVSAPQSSYVQVLPTSFQKTYAPSTQPEIFNYASYPSQNLAIEGNAPLQILRQEPSLIDIGQGLGQGYRSPPQELPLNLGGWGGIDYSGQRSIRLARPVLGIAKLRYGLPVSSPTLSKIGFGPGSW